MKTIFKVISILFVVTLSLFIFGCAESTEPNDKFTVTFKDYDGTILRQEIIQLGHSATAPKDPERYGYIFLGWDNEYTNIQKDTILVAQYERDENIIFEYKVTFIDYDGTILKEEIVQEGSNATPPLNPVREGYEFVGWNNEYANIENDLIVSSKYETIKYTISYELNEGTNHELNPNIYTIEDNVTLNNPTKEGYTFKGWELNGVIVESIPLGTTENIILVAKWEQICSLEYELSSDETYYIITGKGNVTDENLIIPETYKGLPVKEIGDYAFRGCTTLTSIEISNSVTSIGIGAFVRCVNLTAIDIPNNVTTIGSRAFAICKNIINVKIPNGVTMIGDYAFNGCKSLKSIEISNSVTMIGDCAFQGCTSLENIIVDIENYIYDSRENCNGLIETKSNTLIVGCKNTIIPDSVTSIGDYAFEACENLTSIEIPNSVTSIGDYAFSECESLTSIDIPNSVTSIGKGAFLSCINLTNIKISKSLTFIGTQAFDHCTSLSSIIIPKSVSDMGAPVFTGCTNLTIYCEAISKPDGWSTSWNSSNCPVVWGYKEIEIYEENGYKYINLGKYPQTVVTDESIINALSNIDNTNELGYIEYNGNEYKKMVANNWLYFNFVNGNKIVDGKIYYFLVEPIKWRVLEENNGTYKLLCELIIDNRDFYHKVNEYDRIINGQTIYPNNYEYSDIRAWLNGYDGSSYNVDNYNGIGFYDIAFTNYEKEKINNTLVDNSLVSTNESSNNLLCNDTNDKIYLLSKKDVLNETYGFSSTTSADESRKAVVSDYARSKYGSGLWWLRSPKNEYINVARVVARDGDADYPDSLVSDTYYGVRPALTITI